MKNVGISTGHCGFMDTFSNNIIKMIGSMSIVGVALKQNN